MCNSLKCLEIQTQKKMALIWSYNSIEDGATSSAMKTLTNISYIPYANTIGHHCLINKKHILSKSYTIFYAGKRMQELFNQIKENWEGDLDK